MTLTIEQIEERAKTSAMGPQEAAIAAHARAQRDKAVSKAAALVSRAGGTLSTTDEEAIAKALDEGDVWAQRADEYATRRVRRATNALIVREPLTYGPSHPERSWFQDHWAAQRDNGTEAEKRLDRHAREMRVELAARARRPEHRSRGDVIDGATFEKRAPTGGVGQGQEFTVPLWLIDHFASVPRPERVISALTPSFHLPSGVSSVSVPRLTTGAVAQPVVNTAPDPSADITDAGVTSQVVTIPGRVDVPLGLLEQSPGGGAHLDQVIFGDLTAAYDASLEQQVTAGTGGTGITAQLLGVLNLPGIGAVSYTSGSATATAAYQLLGQIYGSIANARKIRAECWVMRGGRWAFFMTGEDSPGRPLGVPDAHNPPPTTLDGVPDPAGG